MRGGGAFGGRETAIRDAKMREPRCGNGWLVDTEITEATEHTEGLLGALRDLGVLCVDQQ